jgi:hypothetical protein
MTLARRGNGLILSRIVTIPAPGQRRRNPLSPESVPILDGRGASVRAVAPVCSAPRSSLGLRGPVGTRIVGTDSPRDRARSGQISAK